MRCPNCGKELPETAAFCIYCGTKIDHAAVGSTSEPSAPIDVQPEESTDEPAAQKQEAAESAQAKPDETVPEQASPSASSAPKSAPLPKPQLPKIPKKTMMIAIGAAAAAAICIGVGVSVSQKVDVGKYVTITYDGYNGYGTVEADFDSEKFAEDNVDKLKLTDAAQPFYMLSGESKEQFIEYVADEGIQLQLDNSRDISNGDKLTAAIYASDLSQYLDGKIVIPDSVSVTVKGLEDANAADVLSSIPISFTGINGAGVPHADLEAINSQYGTAFASEQVTFEPSSGLHNGDQVKVTLSDSLVRDLADHAGIVPSTNTETVTVSGLGEMAVSATGFTDDQLAPFITQGTDTIRSVLAINSVAAFRSAEYVGNDFLLSKTEDAAAGLYVDENGRIGGSDSDPYNKLIMLYKVTLHCSRDEGEADVSYYDAVEFDNVYLDANGNPCVSDMTSTRLLGEGINIPTGLMEEGFFGPVSEITVPTFNHGFYTIDDAQRAVIDRNAQSYTSEANLK